MQQTKIAGDDDYVPVAVYNADKKELAALFQTGGMVARYLYEVVNTKQKKKVYYSLKNKSRIIDTVLGFPVAVRYATEVHKELLGERDFVIMDGYPVPFETKIKGFRSSAGALRKDSDIRLVRYQEEQKNKKQNTII